MSGDYYNYYFLTFLNFPWTLVKETREGKKMSLYLKKSIHMLLFICICVVNVYQLPVLVLEIRLPI